MFLFFFFQAEDGIRDLTVTWSSDVCSSDLRRTAALHHRTLRSGAYQGFLLQRAGTGERRPSAARLPGLLALFRRHGDRAPDGHAETARGHRGACHREEI